MKNYSIKKIDTHTHTYFSFDCGEHESSPYNVCRSACEKGLDAVILTDHIEINSEAEHLYAPFYYEKRKQECEAAREAFKGKLDVYVGIELGQATHYPELTEKTVRENGFDYIIGSVHNTKGEKDFYFVDFSKTDFDHVLYMIDKYFDEYYDMSCLPFVDQCAHITYPLRYLRAAGLDADIAIWRDKIEKILKNIIKSGKTLELNTNSMRLGIELPDDYVIGMYKELGGEKIRLGSDAHYPAHIAADFDKAYKIIDRIYGGKIK